MTDDNNEPIEQMLLDHLKESVAGKGEPEAHSCGNPDCEVGNYFNSKVRALDHDGERYVNIQDLAHHIDAATDFQLAVLMNGASKSGLLDQDDVKDALVNSLLHVEQGAQFAIVVINDMADRKITSLEDMTSMLVSPEALKVGLSAVPEEWTQHHQG